MHVLTSILLTCLTLPPSYGINLDYINLDYIFKIVENYTLDILQLHSERCESHFYSSILIDEFISMANKILEPLSLSSNMSLDRLEHKSVPPSPNIHDGMGQKHHES